MTDALALRYERASNDWHKKVARLGYPAAYRHLVAHAGLNRRPGRILDAGCGTGAFALALHQMSPPLQIDLLDLSGAMRRVARQNLRRVGGAEGATYSSLLSDDLEKGAYDVILAAHIIEHLDDPIDALSVMAGAIAPGGTLLLAVSKPHWCTALIRVIWGHKAFREDTVLGWANKVGLKGTPVPFPSGPPSRTSMGYVLHKPA